MKLVSLLLFISLLVAACGGDSNEDASPASTQAPAPTAAPARLSIANWAADLCAASQTFEDKIAAATGNLSDPTTLPLAERVARGKTVSAVLLPAMQDFINGMSRLNPPAASRTITSP